MFLVLYHKYNDLKENPKHYFHFADLICNFESEKPNPNNRTS